VSFEHLAQQLSKPLLQRDGHATFTRSFSVLTFNSGVGIAFATITRSPCFQVGNPATLVGKCDQSHFVVFTRRGLHMVLAALQSAARRFPRLPNLRQESAAATAAEQHPRIVRLLAADHISDDGPAQPAFRATDKLSANRRNRLLSRHLLAIDRWLQYCKKTTNVHRAFLHRASASGCVPTGPTTHTLIAYWPRDSPIGKSPSAWA
jgi:hypothetical protein